MAKKQPAKKAAPKRKPKVPQIVPVTAFSGLYEINSAAAEFLTTIHLSHDLAFALQVIQEATQGIEELIGAYGKKANLKTIDDLSKEELEEAGVSYT